ncbi:MAG: hypothetical protein QF886_25745, partial [Planctomycetota bacterium]|nr:hypothetical protein [Planctomycetota bacterium]
AKFSAKGAELVERIEGEEKSHQRIETEFPYALRHLRLHVKNNVAEVFSDGELVLSGASRNRLLGKVGVFANAAERTAFDNVVFKISSEVEPVYVQHVVFSGERTMQNWAAAQSDWVSAEWGGSDAYWHRADFWGDVEVRIPLTRRDVHRAEIRICLGALDSDRRKGCVLDVGLADAANVRMLHAGKTLIEKSAVTIPLPATLGFARRGRFFVAELDGEPLMSFPLDDAADGVELGWSASGLALVASDVRIYSKQCKVYTFHQSPVDWTPASGDWQITNRWQCDPRWSFFSGKNTELSALWHKRRYRGDMAIEFAAGIKMDSSRGGSNYASYASNLNITLCGDGKDLTTGYNIVYGGWNNSTTRLLRNNTVVAEASSVRIPV